MYEGDTAPSFRRVAWVALWFIVAVAVLWVLVWFLFFRHTTPKVSTLYGSNAKQSQSSDQARTGSGSNNKSGSTSQNGSATTTPSSTATTPNQLANTGAGNVFVPFALASVAGGTLYYIRLRKKLLS